MQCAVRAHVRDGFVLRAKVPAGCGGEDNLPRARRTREVGDLRERVRVAAVHGDLVALVGIERALLAEAERVAGRGRVRDPACVVLDDRASAAASTDLAARWREREQ